MVGIKQQGEFLRSHNILVISLVSLCLYYLATRDSIGVGEHVPALLAGCSCFLWHIFRFIKWLYSVNCPMVLPTQAPKQKWLLLA